LKSNHVCLQSSFPALPGWDIPRYLKNIIKGGPQYVVSAIFLEKISEGKIGTANPQLFESLRSVNL
jgi:hypothetical protein